MNASCVVSREVSKLSEHRGEPLTDMRIDIAEVKLNLAAQGQGDRAHGPGVNGHNGLPGLAEEVRAIKNRIRDYDEVREQGRDNAKGMRTIRRLCWAILTAMLIGIASVASERILRASGQGIDRSSSQHRVEDALRR